jgi:hypothetical protein
MNKEKGREAARKWLDAKLVKYGNTYFFPESVKIMLNKKIALYGNTFFWK